MHEKNEKRHNLSDRSQWVYDPITGAKIGAAKHVWYVVDSCMVRHLRKLIVFDVILVSALLVLIAVLFVYPEFTFNMNRLEMQPASPPEMAERSYYKKSLSANEGEFYDEVYDALSTCRPGVEAPDPKDISQERVGEIIDAVLMDHPEIFWASKWSYFGTSYKYRVMFSYIVEDPDEIALRAERYQQMAQEAIYEFDPEYEPGKSERTSAMAAHLYEWVCEHAEYVDDDGSGYDQTVMGAFDGNGCVCAGYARAYKYLCDQAGITCYYIVGSTSDEKRDAVHAWNVVTVDKAGIYYVDATWGDEENGPAWKWYTKNDEMFGESHVATSLEMSDIVNNGTNSI